MVYSIKPAQLHYSSVNNTVMRYIYVFICSCGAATVHVPGGVVPIETVTYYGFLSETVLISQTNHLQRSQNSEFNSTVVWCVRIFPGKKNRKSFLFATDRNCLENASEQGSICVRIYLSSPDIPHAKYGPCAFNNWIRRFLEFLLCCFFFFFAKLSPRCWILALMLRLTTSGI